MSLKRSTLEKIITALTFVFIYGFIFYLLDFRLVFTNTTIAGGDTGSQVYIPYYLKQIFPYVRWWSPDWYSGFPFLYFYPPLVYLLTVILSFVIPLNVSFKILIAVCFLIYPLSFYLVFRLFEFKFPSPQIAAVFSLFFIFFEKYTIYGGNLPSLLSGQFSHTLSIPLLFLFLALSYRGICENKYLILNIFIGASVILSHPISGILLIITSPFLLFSTSKPKLKKRLIYLLKVLLGIFLISAFWTIPLLFYREYAGIMNWGKQVNLDFLFPKNWELLSFSALLGSVIAFMKKERKLIPVGIVFLLSGLLYFYLDNSGIWNTRFLPYLNFGILFMAAFFVGYIFNYIWKKTWIICLLLLFVLVFVSLSSVKNNISFSPFWFKWNFEGYQVKQQWGDLDNFFKEVSSLPKGRVLWEFNKELDKYGTPRVLEALPVFTSQPTFEGLLIESSPFGPFHFINQAETSLTPTSAIAGFNYPPFNFAKGIEHMKVSGVKYFVPYTPEVKEEVSQYSESLEKIKELSGGFEIYRLKDSTLVDPVIDFSLLIKNNSWLKKSVNWYTNGDLNTPIVFARDEEEKAELQEIKDNLTIGKAAANVKWGRDFVEFSGSIGSPYIIKNTYFPTWKANGAKGPYLISPSYMMVIPTQQNVKLYFSYGFADWLGIVLTGAGIVFIIVLQFKIKQHKN